MAKSKTHTVGAVKGDSMAGGPKHVRGPMKFPGPENPGQPASMKKALSKKAPRGAATGFAGSVR